MPYTMGHGLRANRVIRNHLNDPKCGTQGCWDDRKQRHESGAMGSPSKATATTWPAGAFPSAGKISAIGRGRGRLQRNVGVWNMVDAGPLQNVYVKLESERSDLNHNYRISINSKYMCKYIQIFEKNKNK